MIRNTKCHRSNTVQRRAFTLIELLVVMTIMVAMMALTASAVVKFIGVQQSSNTKSTLDRAQSQLNKAWSKVKEEALNDPLPPSSPIYQAIQSTLTLTDQNVAGRIRVIYVKLKLRAAFPMTFGEAMNVPYYNPTLAGLGYNANVGSSPVPGLPAYYTYLLNHGINPAALLQTPPDPRESSVCLLMALQRGASGAGANASDLTAGGAAGDYNGMPYLTDAWSRPIFFARAPAGSFYLNPVGSMAGANDPGDPNGYLQTPAWGQTYGPLFTQLTLQITAPTNQSFKLAPMLASGGPANWTKPGAALPFNAITFAPVTGGDSLFSTP